MKIAPIIHTRTYSCDFSPELKVRPETFMDSDVKWARKIILEATKSIDNLQGERWVIADNGKYRLAGVVGFLKNICSKCSILEEERKSMEELFYDDKGRLVYAFIGIVINISEIDNSIILTYDDLWNIFIKFIQPVWKRIYQEVITTNFDEYELKGISDKFFSIEPEQVGERKIHEANSNMDYKLFCWYLCNKSENNITFCSNITDINTVKESEFKIITTSSNIITRLKRMNRLESVKKTEREQEVNSKESTVEKKKLLILLIICLISCIVLLVILVLSLV